MNDKYKYLFKNTFFLTISSVGSSLLSFLLVPLYTAVLLTEEFGVADLMDTTVLLLFYVFALDISDVVARYSMDDINKPMVLKTGLVFLTKSNLIVLVVILFMSIVDVFDWPLHLYALLVVQYLIHSYYLTISQFLKGIDQVHRMAASSIVVTIVRIVSAIVFLVFLKMRLEGFIVSNLLGLLCGLAVCLGGLKGIDLKKTPYDQHMSKSMVKYAVPMAINALGWWVAQGIDKYFVSYYYGYSENGIYSVSYKIPSILLILCNVFNQAFGISAVKELNSKEQSAFFTKTYLGFHSLLCITCSGLVLFNVLGTKILFAESYYEAWKFTSLLVVSSMFAGLAGYLGGVCDALKQNRILALSTCISAAVNIVLNFILIPLIGTIGAAIATLVSMYIIFIIRLVYVRKRIEIGVSFFVEQVVYLMLIVQAVFDRMGNEWYFAQIVLLILIMIIRKNVLIVGIKQLFLVLKRGRGNSDGKGD